MVALGIGTGFDRGYGVLKRLAATPLGRPRLLGAKIISVIGVELVQVVVLVLVGWALGWSPNGGWSSWPASPSPSWCSAPSPSVGLGLSLAGTLAPLVNLAIVNSLFVVLLLLGGCVAVRCSSSRAGWPTWPGSFPLPRCPMHCTAHWAPG